MFIERSLQYTSEENDRLLAKSEETAQATKFMKAFPMAKIAVIIDTHTTDNGFFVWLGEDEETYHSCSLLEVGVAHHPTCFMLSLCLQILKDCSPKSIFEYMSEAKDTPCHHHKTLIVNLACGASISMPQPQSELLPGWALSDVLTH